MARVLIYEPHREVLHLLERAVRRLGHLSLPASAEPGEADIALVDADDERSVGWGLELRVRAPALPLVALSIYPPDQAPGGLSPTSHLLKPFTRAELERAIAQALDGTLGEWPSGSTPTAPSAT